jgi:hypothetical protein
MNNDPSSERPESDKGAERRVKSVNFTDHAVFEFATRRADNLFGGNFSAYVTALIERDRSSGESRRLLHDLEGQIMDIVAPFGGVVAASDEAYDFAVPSLNLVIEAQSRFPRERQIEYRLLSAIQKVSLTTPGKRIALVFPENLSAAEKERFRQFETAGIEGLRVCDTAELKRFLAGLADPAAADLENALRVQDAATASLKDPTEPGWRV